MPVLAFSGSNSSTSINEKLITIAQSIIKIDRVSLRKLTIPMYSTDLEKSDGLPHDIRSLIEQIKPYSSLLISTPEHNGYTTAFFKNILDWFSRADSKFLAGKQIFLMSTSPGKKGGISARDQVEKILGYLGATDIKTYSLASFSQSYNDETKTLTESDLSDLRSFLGT